MKLCHTTGSKIKKIFLLRRVSAIIRQEQHQTCLGCLTTQSCKFKVPYLSFTYMTQRNSWNFQRNYFWVWLIYISDSFIYHKNVAVAFQFANGNALPDIYYFVQSVKILICSLRPSFQKRCYFL